MGRERIECIREHERFALIRADCISLIFPFEKRERGGRGDKFLHVFVHGRGHFFLFSSFYVEPIRVSQEWIRHTNLQMGETGKRFNGLIIFVLIIFNN